MRRKWIFVALLVLSCGSGLSFANIEALIELHFRYAGVQSTFSAPWTFAISTSHSEDDIWFLFSELTRFLEKNVLYMLETSERARELSRYLNDGNRLLAHMNAHEHRLNAESQAIELKMEACEGDLERANLLFSESMNTINPSLFKRAVQQAQDARRCIGEQYVLKNATHTLILKLQGIKAKLAPRIQYLQEHQTLLIKHYDILKPSLLSELYQASLQLGASE